MRSYSVKQECCTFCLTSLFYVRHSFVLDLQYKNKMPSTQPADVKLVLLKAVYFCHHKHVFQFIELSGYLFSYNNGFLSFKRCAVHKVELDTNRLLAATFPNTHSRQNYDSVEKSLIVLEYVS